MLFCAARRSFLRRAMGGFFLCAAVRGDRRLHSWRKAPPCYLTFWQVLNVWGVDVWSGVFYEVQGCNRSTDLHLIDRRAVSGRWWREAIEAVCLQPCRFCML